MSTQLQYRDSRLSQGSYRDLPALVWVVLALLTLLAAVAGWLTGGTLIAALCAAAFVLIAARRLYVHVSPRW